MKNKGIIITLIILLSVIIFGLVMFLVKALSGGMNMPFFNLGTKKSDTIIFDQNYKFEDINNIKVISAAGDVTFKETEGNEIRVIAYGKQESDIDVNMTNNKLEIDYSKTNRNFFSFNVKSNDIIIYLPSNYSGNIKINNDYGNCKLCDLESATISADVDCGNVELGKIKNADIKCDLGNAKIDYLLNKCNIEADCGNVEIENAEIYENSAIKCDLGNVRIKKINDVYVDGSVDLGDNKIGKNNRQSEITLKIEVDCGNLEVSE